jgi:hypothetical protein
METLRLKKVRQWTTVVARSLEWDADRRLEAMEEIGEKRRNSAAMLGRLRLLRLFHPGASIRTS